MSRTRNPEIAKRNEVIYSEWLRGATLTGLGERYGLSRQVVARAVAALHPEEDESTDRALFRGHLWRLFDEVREVYDSPGWKMSPTGRPAVGPDDEPAEDVMAKIEAAKLQLAVLESLRKLDARDKPAERKLTIDVTEAQRRKDESLAAIAAQKEAIETRHRLELEEARRSAFPAVIPGEVLRELQPGQQRGERAG